MGKVFISWGSPDADAVQPLYRRLQGLGLDFYNYIHDMETGSDIADAVLEEIKSAEAVILCLSDRALERPWIQVEQTAAAVTRRPVLPVQVGPLADDRLPLFLRTKSTFILDLTGPAAEQNLARLVQDLSKALGASAPIVVPAAILAMTCAQCGLLFEAWKASPEQKRRANEGLKTLCATLGMGEPPALYDLLKGRYGDRAEDLAPFAPGRRLVDLIAEALGPLNLERRRAGERPLFLRWVQRELAQDDDEALNLWRENDSLLVVDSVSMFCPEVAAQLGSLPPLREPARVATLWVPPYSQITARLEQPLRDAVHDVLGLRYALRDLEQDLWRLSAFDLGTSLSLRVWVFRLLREISGVALPLEGPLREMNAAGRLRPRQHFYRAA